MVTAALAPLRGQANPPGQAAHTDRSLQTSDIANDALLAVAIARGDVAALDELYRRFRQPAFATALALLRDSAAAEDAVHDAFLRAWRSAATFQAGRGSLRSWLLTIVRNTAIDQLRARQLAMRPQSRLISESIDSEGDGEIFASVAMAADARRLHEALHSLPTAQRHALELAFFAGLTHGEIAEKTGTPLGTVKGRVRLGLRRLRQDLVDLTEDMEAIARPESPLSAA